MPVDPTIESVPDRVAAPVRACPARHDRSAEQEPAAIVGRAAREEAASTSTEILAEVRRPGLATPSEAVAILREGRDRR